MTSTELGRWLPAIARSAIAGKLRLPAAPDPVHEDLQRPRATFVTLRRDGQLRGCIGSLQAVRGLGEDVRANAIAAAFCDPRFAPLGADELEDTLVEVSVLSDAEAIDAADEDDLIARLQPGVDGLILEFGGRRATFLPQVWESLADPRDFLAALKQKAQLPERFWSPHMRVLRYGVSKWTEHA